MDIYRWKDAAYGQQKCVKEEFKEAKGGVLFIDEAYSLLDNRAGSYGDEAINTIVQEMDKPPRGTGGLIFAGYPEKMEEFIQKNPGLILVIAFHVSFPDYNELELCQIAQLMVDKSNRVYSGSYGKTTDCI